jgi:hypothetical protein
MYIYSSWKPTGDIAYLQFILYMFSIVLKLMYSKTWLIQNPGDQKKVFWIMKNLYNSKF